MYAGSVVTSTGQILPCLVGLCPYQGASHLVHVSFCYITVLTQISSPKTLKQATEFTGVKLDLLRILATLSETTHLQWLFLEIADCSHSKKRIICSSLNSHYHSSESTKYIIWLCTYSTTQWVCFLECIHSSLNSGSNVAEVIISEIAWCNSFELCGHVELIISLSLK